MIVPGSQDRDHFQNAPEIRAPPSPNPQSRAGGAGFVLRGSRFVAGGQPGTAHSSVGSGAVFVGAWVRVLLVEGAQGIAPGGAREGGKDSGELRARDRRLNSSLNMIRFRWAARC